MDLAGDADGLVQTIAHRTLRPKHKTACLDQCDYEVSIPQARLSVLCFAAGEMPLYPNARALIRKNLEALQRKERGIAPIAIGTLTEAQLAVINRWRADPDNSLPPITAEILFVGHHVYKSRRIKDGYTIDDILDQITSALDETSIPIVTEYMTVIENPTTRTDRYGNEVCDRAVFECSTRHPRPELFSVTPKGDSVKPKK